jgi:hypothetical protein
VEDELAGSASGIDPVREGSEPNASFGQISGQVDQPLHRAAETIAREQRKAIERKIADLSALDHELAQIIEKCGHGTVAECGILEALSPS